jgi:iron complex outermembrane recepter protein
MRLSGSKLVTLAVSSIMTSQVHAATTSSVPTGGVLEEITVTATKRSESAQDVGIAINAFSQEQLASLGVRDSTDVAKFTPGVYLGGSIAGQTSLFTIRGVTQNDFTDSVESPIAVYVDEGYIAMAQGQSFGLFDLDRVEVAKGPQGTLFGRNATGGLIHYITRQPTRTAEGYFDASVASHSDIRVEGAIGGPIGETFAGRIAIVYNKFDPILKNSIPASALQPTLPGAGGGEAQWNDDTRGVRAQLLWAPNDRFDGTLSVQYQRTRTSTGPYVNSATVPVYDQQGRLVETINASPTETRQAIQLDANGQDSGGTLFLGGGLGVLNGCFTGFNNPAPCTFRPTPGGDSFGYVAPTGFVTQSDFAYEDLNRFSSGAVALRLNYKISDAIKLSSITNGMRFTKFVGMDVDAAPEPQSVFHSRSHESTYSEELRLSNDARSGLKWVGGLYYLNIVNRTENGLLFPATSPFATSPIILGDPAHNIPPPGPVDTVGWINLHTISTSIFGQVDVPLAAKWTLVAGARGVKEKKNYSFFQGVYQNADDRIINTSILYVPLFDFAKFRTDDTLWAGKVQIEFRPQEGMLWFLGVNRGSKAGGFNAQLADGSPRLPPDQIPYKPETLTSVEGGVKSTWLDGRLRVNASVYHYDYKDYQAFLFVQSSGVVVNKDAKMDGGELEITASPVHGLELQLGVSAFTAKVKDLELRGGPPGVPVLFHDVKPSFAPERQISGLIRYTWDLPRGQLSTQVDAHYTSDFFHNLRNFEADHYPGYTIGNARVAWTDDHWEVAAFVQNLTDKRYYTIGYDLATLCGCNENAFGRPRWTGLDVKYRFGR